MKVSVDSIIKQLLCSRNYGEKFETVQAKKSTPKFDILGSKLGCLKGS